VVTHQAILSIENSVLSLRPAMTLTADIVVLRLTDTLLIANAALRFTPPAAPQGEATGGGGLPGPLPPRRPSDQPAAPRAPSPGGVRTIWALTPAPPWRFT
jgi:HlyD family secretion protein